ncbi:FmdB family zinc ribbon protein [Cellulomonas sp. URHB0016]
MPTYAYACTACGHAFEIQQSFSDDSLSVCPECEGRLRKVFSSVGVVFKGSGFYRNDARSGSGSKKSSSIPASTSGESSSSSSTSSESSSSSSAPVAAAASSSSGSSGAAAKPAASA